MAPQTNTRVAIGAVMRDETDYIVEWIAWHRLLGFEIIIADNGSCDGRQTELLVRAEKAGLIRRIDFRAFTMSPQMPAFMAMYDFAKQENIPIIGFIDADEFFEPLQVDRYQDSGRDLIVKAFKETGKTLACYNWICFGSRNDGDNDIKIPVMRRFIHGAPQTWFTNRHVKSFMCISKVEEISQDAIDRYCHPHGLNVDGTLYCHDGAISDAIFSDSFGISKATRWTSARVRHYVVKSRLEYETKRRRGRPTIEFQRHENDYFAQHDRNDTTYEMPAHALEALAAEIQAVKALIDGVTITTIADVDIAAHAAGRYYAHIMGHYSNRLAILENRLNRQIVNKCLTVLRKKTKPMRYAIKNLFR